MTKKCFLYSVGVVLFSPVLFAKTHFADVQITHLDPEVAQVIWLRKSNNTPKYPIALAKKGIKGCAIYTFNIDSRGDIGDVELVSAIPTRVLPKEAKKLLENIEWKIADGQNTGVEKRTTRIDYCMGGESVEQAQQQCIAQSKLACSTNN